MENIDWDEGIRLQAFTVAKRVKETCRDKGITSKSTDEELDAIAISMALVKKGQVAMPYKQILKGQKWYSRDLRRKVSLSGLELLLEEYNELLPSVMETDELVDLLDKI